MRTWITRPLWPDLSGAYGTASATLVAMTRLVLIRHGESNSTVARVIGGHRTCSGLSPLGRKQAEALAERLAGTGEIVADVLIASSFAAIPAETLQDFAQFAPPAVAARAMRMYSRLRIADRMNPPFNLIISNVPGPPYPLYSAGARLEHFYPVSAIADGQGLNMTVQSYDGNLDFGFIADRGLVPDVWLLTELLHESMAELLTLR